MITKREMVLIIILLVMITGTGYYLLFYRPMTQRITQTANAIADKTAALDYALLREMQYVRLTDQNEALADEWAQATASLPAWLDDADILRRLQRIIYPYTWDIDVVFPDGPAVSATKGDEQDTPATTDVYTVRVGFSVPYKALQAILQGLENESVDNRVIHYEINLAEDIETGVVYYQTILEIDFLVDKSE